MNFIQKIKESRQNQTVNIKELQKLIEKANLIYTQNFSNEVYFERSVFINWTCSIADCKYCYLSTKPKHDPGQEIKALRSKESILAEILICRSLGWEVGYITGGLRVESTAYLIDLIQKINLITNKKIMMNFGPYPRSLIEKFQPYVPGMGAAIESFDEELHNFICPSKPLRSLLQFLKDLQELHLEKLITIILGLGENKEDIFAVIENIKKYNIEKVQLCFLKPQEKTIFDEVTPPNIKYMAWWVARIRIACPTMQIKVALVKERIGDFSLLLKAGANSFSRFMVFTDFASPAATVLEQECWKAGRRLKGNFTELPQLDFQRLVKDLPFDEGLKAKIFLKAEQYYEKLKKLEENYNLRVKALGEKVTRRHPAEEALQI